MDKLTGYILLTLYVGAINVLGLEYALGLGFKAGSIAAGIGFLFASFYKKPERKEPPQPETQSPS